jgi:hypothetical protein
MFFHIASIEREVYWQIGNVTCSAYPLKYLDTIHSEVFFQLMGQTHEIFDPWFSLRVMLHSAESTHIREYLFEIETKVENILG